jgi:hypothetical protein
VCFYIFSGQISGSGSWAGFVSAIASGSGSGSATGTVLVRSQKGFWAWSVSDVKSVIAKIYPSSYAKSYLCSSLTPLNILVQVSCHEIEQEGQIKSFLMCFIFFSKYRYKNKQTSFCSKLQLAKPVFLSFALRGDLRYL